MSKLCYGALIVATLAAAVAPTAAQTPPDPATNENGQSIPPAGAHSYFVNLKDGDTVTSPFKVVFGLTPSMGVAPAGVDKPNVGHHHLLIDTTLSPDELVAPIPADEQHIHFGKGQTETTLKLAPGRHTLQLVLGNWSHIPFATPVQSEVITITVKDPTAAVPTAAAMPAADAKAAAEATAVMPATAAMSATTGMATGTIKPKLGKHASHHHHHHSHRVYVRYIYLK